MTLAEALRFVAPAAREFQLNAQPSRSMAVISVEKLAVDFGIDTHAATSKNRALLRALDFLQDYSAG